MLLSEHHYCGRALAQKLKISQSAISQHLKVLKNAGVVNGTKIGYQMHYQLNQTLLLKLADYFHSQFAKYAAAAQSPEDCACEFEGKCIKREQKGW